MVGAGHSRPSVTVTGRRGPSHASSLVPRCAHPHGQILGSRRLRPELGLPLREAAFLRDWAVTHSIARGLRVGRRIPRRGLGLGAGSALHHSRSGLSRLQAAWCRDRHSGLLPSLSFSLLECKRSQRLRGRGSFSGT